MSAAVDRGAPMPLIPLDDLTGLPGRAAFMGALERALSGLSAEAQAPRPILLVLDLDRFKAVNDTLGHPVGDAVLRGAAGRIRSALRRQDLAGRLGGDEFAVLLEAPATLEEAAGIARRLVELMARPFLADGQVAQIGLSVGIAQAGPGAAAASLFKQADLALYAAKARGRGCHAVFEPAMQRAAEERASMIGGLRAALHLGQFRLAYQPLLEVQSARIVGVEALIRWQRPGAGLISPARFLPLAEELGLMPAIGAWVLRTACQDAASWDQKLTVSVNVAPSQFADGRLPALVEAVLRETGLAPARLELEVTENALFDTTGASPLDQFHALRALGVHIALDDFGTGYSSLSQLRGFPFHRVKLDRSFAGDMPMMRAAIGVGRALGLATTAEGIEAPEQLAAARAEGCDVAQGFLISTPLPPEELRAFIAAHGLAASGDPS